MANFSTRLKSAIKLTEDTYQYDFAWNGEAIPFEAGQFFLLEVEDGGPKATRAYSTASAPGNKELFSLVLKLIPGGRASEFLRKMELGHEVKFQGPFGHFKLTNSEKDLIMVATGTGLAPYMGMLAVLLEKGWKKPIRLYFGVRFQEDLFYVDQLRTWEQQHPNFKAFVTLSRPPEGWTGLSGRVTDHLKDIDAQNSQVFICGNGDMVKSVKELMEQKGVPKEDLHFELFSAH